MDSQDKTILEFYHNDNGNDVIYPLVVTNTNNEAENLSSVQLIRPLTFNITNSKAHFEKRKNTISYLVRLDNTVSMLNLMGSLSFNIIPSTIKEQICIIDKDRKNYKRKRIIESISTMGIARLRYYVLKVDERCGKLQKVTSLTQDYPVTGTLPKHKNDISQVVLNFNSVLNFEPDNNLAVAVQLVSVTDVNSKNILNRDTLIQKVFVVGTDSLLC